MDRHEAQTKIALEFIRKGKPGYAILAVVVWALPPVAIITLIAAFL